VNEQQYVNYTLMGRDYQAGPYRSVDEADEHRRDIKSFAGVTHCWVANGRDPKRILISEAA
jgi:hypothetical protein